MTEPVEQYRADSIMAMNAFNRIAGGLANPLSGLGTMRDRTTSSSIVRGRVLSQGEINTLYYGDAFIQKAIDLVVKEAYRSWVTFDFADNTKLKAGDFLQYMWRLKFGKGKLAAREAFLQASVLARKDGDAFILVGVVDDALLEEPVGDKIESIAWLRVMSKWELYPEPFWLKAQEEDFGDELPQDALQPDFYRVARSGQRVHHTRVLRFSGNRICDRSEIIGNSYFHHSIIQSMYKAYSRWEEGLGYGAAILGDIETYTLGIKGMGKLLQDDLNNKTTKGQEALLLRGQSISMGRSVVKTLLYDLEGEQPGNVARGYTGAEGIMDRLERAWAASSGIPRWKLFEESGSAGLASSVGSAQILRFMWADIASTWASENWKEPLDQLSFLVFKAKDSPTKGAIPDEWGEDSAKFPNTISLSRQEQMELEKLAAERAQILVQMGAIAPEEVRREYEGSSFSINIPLLPEVDKRMKEQLRTPPPQPQPQPTQELPVDTPVNTDEFDASGDNVREDATWGIWVSTRTTPFVCEASSREEAISKLRKSSVAGHDAKVVSARQLEGSSLRKVRRGEWVRERANGEMTGGKSKVRPWLFDEDDTITHFSAGLISRIDALEMLGYENAEDLASRVDQEFIEQTTSIDEVKTDDDDIVFPSSYQNVLITVDDLNQLLQLRVDDEELLQEAIASVCGEQLAELLEMRHDVTDKQLWLEAISEAYCQGQNAQSYKNDSFQGFIDFAELQAREWGGAEVFLIQRANLPDLFAVGFKSEVEAEEMYLSIAPLDGYLGIEDLNVPTLDADDIRLDRTYVRDARGRFAKVGSTGSKEHPEKKVEIPERITTRTNIAQLKAIADKHGIKTPQAAHKRASWHEAIKAHPEGAQYFEKKPRGKKTPSTVEPRVSPENTDFKGIASRTEINRRLGKWTQDYRDAKLYIRKGELLGDLDSVREAIDDIKDSPRQAQRLKSLRKDEERLNKALAKQEEKIKAAGDSPYATANARRLFENYEIAAAIKQDTSSPKLAVLDKNGNLAAAATYTMFEKSSKEPGFMYIDYLATAPWNMAKTDKTARGAGTHAIIEAVKHSQEQGHEGRVRLTPLDSAKSFYDKLGFKPMEDDPFTYELTPEAANNLLGKVGAVKQSGKTSSKVFKGSIDTKQIDKDLDVWIEDHKEIGKILKRNETLEQIKKLEENASLNQFYIKELRRHIRLTEQDFPKNSPYLKVNDPVRLADNYGIGYGLATSKGVDKVGIYDAKGNLQAAASYELRKEASEGVEKHLYVSYLATAPWNVAKTDKTVRGAGTHAIIEAVKVSQKEGLGGRVRLFPVEGAENFYKKLGFEPDEASFGDWELSPTKAKELLKKVE